MRSRPTSWSAPDPKLTAPDVRRFGLLLLVVLSLASGAGANEQFAVDGRRLLRGGVAFQVRGVCYQPTPIGDDPARAAPRGDYYTPEYAALWARDLPLLRALGANVVRIYGWNPAGDHRAFLDACYNGGRDPLHVLVNRWIEPSTPWDDPRAIDRLTAEFLEIDERLGDHPAVLAIVIGNESNAHHGNGERPAFRAGVGSIENAIKRQSPRRLVSAAITDAIPQIAAHDAALAGLDFWCVQTYRGESMGSLFDEYAKASPRPLVLTEFGVDAFDHASGKPYPENGAIPAGIIASLWREIAANGAVCSGGCVFAFADEWWKSGGATTHDAGGFPLGSLPDGFANEEWWGLFAVAPDPGGLDRLIPRASFEALRAAWSPVPSEVPPHG